MARVWRWIVPFGIGLVWLVHGAPAAEANRFGPPWQSRVTVDQAILYTQPDRGAPAVGPLGRDRKTSTLTYLSQDGQPQFSTYVSLGRAGVETPDGDYATRGKYKFDNMTSASMSGADHEYHLPNVPFTQYYRDGGYAIHATYWHDHFGSVESQGCINLTWADAAYLFNLTKPDVAPGDVARWALGDLPSTPMVIVD